MLENGATPTPQEDRSCPLVELGAQVITRNARKEVVNNYCDPGRSTFTLSADCGGEGALVPSMTEFGKHEFVQRGRGLCDACPHRVEPTPPPQWM